MKKLSSSSSSSAETDTFVSNCPSPQRERIQGYINELQTRRDAVDRQHHQRSRNIEAAIEKAYLDHLTHVEALPLGERSVWLRQRIGYSPGRYGLDGKPSLVLVRRVVYRLST